METEIGILVGEVISHHNHYILVTGGSVGLSMNIVHHLNHS
jgi:hypothetical protein